MARRSGYQQRQDAEKYAWGAVNFDWGREVSWDTLQIILHRKYGWGAKRLKALNDEAEEVCKEVMRGLEKRQDADYYRAKTDQIMVEIYGDEAAPWEERYTGWTEGSVLRERRWKE